MFAIKNMSIAIVSLLKWKILESQKNRFCAQLFRIGSISSVSRISQTGQVGEGQPPLGGGKSLLFGKTFCWKVNESERNWT